MLPALAGASPAPPDPAMVMRLLKTDCLSCHNDAKRKGGLALTSREAMLKGGEEGVVVIEGKPEESTLIQSLAAGADPHMPPKKQLPAAKITLLTEWLRAGAPWDAAALAGEASPPRAVALAQLPASYRPVMSLALSPDGTRLAVGCGNELVIFTVGASSLAFHARAHAHLDPVQSIAWTTDGKQLITGAFRRVIVWKAEPLEQVREITASLTDRITVLLSLPDGPQIVVADGLAGEKGIVRMLDPLTGRILRSWPAHGDTIFAMALSSDGKQLATAGGDKLAKIWDVATGKETARLEAHSTQVL